MGTAVLQKMQMFDPPKSELVNGVGPEPTNPRLTITMFPEGTYVVGGGQTCSPNNEEFPVPPRHDTCACISAGKGQRGLPIYCPHIACHALPPSLFPPPALKPGQWRRHTMPGRGKQPPTLFTLTAGPPGPCDWTDGCSLRVWIESCRIIVIKGVLRALWTPPLLSALRTPPPSMDDGVGWKVFITRINHLEDE